MTGKTLTQRIAFWDNAKFLMLVLVIFGHATERFYNDGSVIFGIWLTIYLVHMPIMMFISGYFSSSVVTEKSKRKTVELLIIYIVWEILFALIKFVFFERTPTTNFLVKPSFAMWFILALFLMRILLPYVLMLVKPL